MDRNDPVAGRSPHPRLSRRSVVRGGVGAGVAALGRAAAGSPARAGRAGQAGQAATPAATRLAAILAPSPASAPIDHVVVFLENHSFDSVYGLFPEVNGLPAPGAEILQVDRSGRPYGALPAVIKAEPRPAPDERFPAALPNAPFPLDRCVPLDQIVSSPVHRFSQHILQLDGGRLDRYVAWTDSGALPMGYNDTAKLPLFPYARDDALADSFFTAALGGSILNHFWLVAAATPVWPNAPAAKVAPPSSMRAAPWTTSPPTAT